MTPGARVAAAIEVLDLIGNGAVAEQALTRWGRSNRFAGSKDRAAIRDHVFDVLRQKRRAAAMGGGSDGRAMMIGALRLAGGDIDALFSGEGHAPAPLDAEELRDHGPLTMAEEWDLPDWLVPHFQDSLQDQAEACAKALQHRAPITLRVNLAKTSVARAAERLRDLGVETRPNPLAETALSVTQGARKIRNSDVFADGWIELQDAASQAVTAALPIRGRVLDYCAGGGGKSLAMAMDRENSVHAHDIDPNRTKDLPARAARAGAKISVLGTAQLDLAGGFDLVLCDAPCSGSGAWRRAPEGKWTLTPDRLSELMDIQLEVLGKARALVAPGGWLIYATCSVLRDENEGRVAEFLRQNPDWSCRYSKRHDVCDDGDGFFEAHLTRA